jgi:hypothetical protein
MPRTARKALDLARKIRDWTVSRNFSEQREYWDMGIKVWGEYQFQEYSGNCGEVNISIGEHLNRCQASAYELSVKTGSKTKNFYLDSEVPTREEYGMASKLFNTLSGRTSKL